MDLPHRQLSPSQADKTGKISFSLSVGEISVLPWDTLRVCVPRITLCRACLQPRDNDVEHDLMRFGMGRG